jgi:hypothetical protein
MTRSNKPLTFTRSNAPGVYFVKLDADKRRKVLGRLRLREQQTKATGQEIWLIMLSNDHPDWNMYERIIRMRTDQNKLVTKKSYTLMSPDTESRLRERSRKPKPVQPMKSKRTQVDADDDGEAYQQEWEAHNEERAEREVTMIASEDEGGPA